MATKEKEYKAKFSCRGVIPYWVEPIIGKDNYSKLQKGDSVKLPLGLQKGVYQFMSEVPTRSKVKKTAPKKKK